METHKSSKKRLFWFSGPNDVIFLSNAKGTKQNISTPYSNEIQISDKKSRKVPKNRAFFRNVIKKLSFFGQIRKKSDY